MTEEEMITWIDDADYEQLLRKWRFAPAGDPFFQGLVGQHYSEAMARKRDEVGCEAAAAASKRIGWER